jgi:ElaB/YqjD/DUF883 family membrane-anchored ribosome-binding protein
MPQTVWEKTGEQITDAIEDGVSAAKHAARRATDAADDLLNDTSRGIRKHPLSTVTTTFAVAFVAGMLLGRFTRRG